MAVRCVNCGYEMKTGQEVVSTVTHIIDGLIGSSSVQQSLLGGIMNQKIGKSKGVKCPKCEKVGCWEDV